MPHLLVPQLAGRPIFVPGPAFEVFSLVQDQPVEVVASIVDMGDEARDERFTLQLSLREPGDRLVFEPA